MSFQIRHREFAVEVVQRLRSAGFEALWAGGCVRDLLLGLEPTDYDVATSATPEQVMGLFRRTIPVGVSFGVVRVRGPRGAGEVEVATFRSDGAYLDGRHPASVTFSTAEQDAARRDFTINGMFLDPLTDTVIDYVGGKADLENRLLRAIGDPEARFAEDKLRLIRAVRFASRFALEIEPRTKAALITMAPQIRVVAVERIAQELRRMLTDCRRAQALALAFEVGLVAAIVPDLTRLHALEHRESKHSKESLWDHTLNVLDRLPTKSGFSLACAALLHEVGQTVEPVEANTEAPERIGRQIAERIGSELKLSNAERERIGWLVEHHRALRTPNQLRLALLKRLLAAPGIEELLALHRADALASGKADSHVTFCERYLQELPDGPLQPAPLVTGHDLQAAGWKPGPEFKGMLERAYDGQLEGLVGTKAEALDWLKASEASSDPSPPHEQSNDPSPRWPSAPAQDNLE